MLRSKHQPKSLWLCTWCVTRRDEKHLQLFQLSTAIKHLQVRWFFLDPNVQFSPFPSHLSYKYYYSVQIADTLPNTVYVEQCLDHFLNSSKKLTRVKDKMRDAWLKLSCLHPFLYWNMTKCQSSKLSTVVFIDHNEPHNEPHIKKSNLKHLLAVFTAASDVILMFAVLIAALFHEPGNPATMLT